MTKIIWYWKKGSQSRDPFFNEKILPNLEKNAPECIGYYNIIFDIVNDDIRLKYPKSMTKLTDHLYLGSIHDAQDLGILKENGITHIIDTVKSTKIPKSPRKFQKENSQDEIPKVLIGEKIKYFGFTSQDDGNYPIMEHFDDVFKFIENAEENDGKCLIHCLEGINRSGVLATAYLMVKNKIGPIPAARYVFERRGMILSNTSFIVALLILAKEKKLLEVQSVLNWANYETMWSKLVSCYCI